MLNKPIEEIIVENGKVIGVKSEGEVSSFYNIKVLCSCEKTLYYLVSTLFGMDIDGRFQTICDFL